MAKRNKILLIILVLVFTALPVRVSFGNSRSPHEYTVMKGINDYRVLFGKHEIWQNLETCLYAEKRLRDISKVFSHAQFYRDKANLGIWRENLGIWYENLAKNISGDNVVSAWIASPRHRAVILSDMTSLCVRGDDESGLWVMIGH